MGFALYLNDYFVDNMTVFAVILYSALAIIMVLFIITFIHGFRGTRYPFVLWMTTATIADIMLYVVYSTLKIYAQTDETEIIADDAMFALALAIFQVQHWIIAFTYYKSALELRYVDQGVLTPDNKR